jgi:hypothetical protein
MRTFYCYEQSYILCEKHFRTTGPTFAKIEMIALKNPDQKLISDMKSGC